MRMIPKEQWYELAVFLMDWHSGQASRGYRLLSKLNPENFSSTFCEEMRATEVYAYLVDTYKGKV
jgi:hypothetical protein